MVIWVIERRRGEGGNGGGGNGGASGNSNDGKGGGRGVGSDGGSRGVVDGGLDQAESFLSKTAPNLRVACLSTTPLTTTNATPPANMKQSSLMQKSEEEGKERKKDGVEEGEGEGKEGNLEGTMNNSSVLLTNTETLSFTDAPLAHDFASAAATSSSTTTSSSSSSSSSSTHTDSTITPVHTHSPSFPPTEPEQPGSNSPHTPQESLQSSCPFDVPLASSSYDDAGSISETAASGISLDEISSTTDDIINNNINAQQQGGAPLTTTSSDIAIQNPTPFVPIPSTPGVDESIVIFNEIPIDELEQQFREHIQRRSEYFYYEYANANIASDLYLYIFGYPPQPFLPFTYLDPIIDYLLLILFK